MAEEIEQEQETETTETDEKVTDTQQSKSGKTFTQEEVNKFLAKEKASWKKSADKAATDHEDLVKGLRDDISKRDEVITKQLELLTNDLELDEDTKELLEGLDVLARYEWVLKRVEKLGKREIPRTPQGSGKRIEGKYPFSRRQTV